MSPNSKAKSNAAASANENKKRSASSDEAQEVEGDSKRSCHSSSPSPIDFGLASIDNSIIEEGVKDYVAEKWPEFEPMFRQQVSKDIDSKMLSLLSPFTKEDGAIHNDLSFFQGISQNAMEIVGEFFEAYRGQMGHAFLEKESAKEHKSTPRTIGEDEDYDIGGATPSFVGEGEDNLGGAEEEA